MNWTGGCLCGRIRFVAAQAPRRAHYCHCRTCRKASGAPFMAFVTFPVGALHWSAGEPGFHASSDGISRRFCRDCGSTLTREGGGGVQVALGALDSPEAVVPERHCFTRQRLPGLAFIDGLPEDPGDGGNADGRAPGRAA